MHEELLDSPSSLALRLRSFEVGEAQVRPPWGVRRPPGGWDTHFYVLRGAPCHFLSDGREAIAFRKLSICLVNDRGGHSFQDDLGSPIRELALPMRPENGPQFRARQYGGASGDVTSSFYIGGALERANLQSTLDLPSLVVLEFDEAPDWLFAGVSLIKQEMERRDFDTGAAGRLCEFLLAKTVQAYRERQPPGLLMPGSYRVVDRRLRRAMALIDADIAASWTLSGLAEASGISRSRLTARWQSEMRVSIFDYISQRRMERGAELLARTALDIATIARRVGYSSHAAFSTAFKRTFEQSPTQYRTEGRANSTPSVIAARA